MAQNIAICGLNCSECEAFIATRNDDDELRRKTAEDWTRRYEVRKYGRPPLIPDDINCLGCHSDTVFQYCLVCEVRKCGLEKEIKNCGECEDYRCDRLVELHEKIPVARENCDIIRNN